MPLRVSATCRRLRSGVMGLSGQVVGGRCGRAKAIWKSGREESKALCDRSFYPKSAIRLQSGFVLPPCRLAAAFAEGVAGYAETKRQRRCRQEDERAWKAEERQPNLSRWPNGRLGVIAAFLCWHRCCCRCMTKAASHTAHRCGRRLCVKGIVPLLVIS